MRCIVVVSALLLSAPALAVTGVPVAPAATGTGIGQPDRALQMAASPRVAGAVRCWGCSEPVATAQPLPAAAAPPSGWERVKRGISGIAQRFGGLFGG